MTMANSWGCLVIGANSRLCYLKDANAALGRLAMTRPTAAEINEHLETGGVFQVTTYTRSTVYSKKHAGWFFEKGGSLYVKHGRSSVILATDKILLVGLRFGNFGTAVAS
jgi:hypothetical protein